MSLCFLLQIEKQAGSLDVIYKQAKVGDKPKYHSCWIKVHSAKQFLLQ